MNKQFQIGEQHRFQFRIEFFNLLVAAVVAAAVGAEAAGDEGRAGSGDSGHSRRNV